MKGLAWSPCASALRLMSCCCQYALMRSSSAVNDARVSTDRNVIRPSFWSKIAYKKPAPTNRDEVKPRGTTLVARAGLVPLVCANTHCPDDGGHPVGLHTGNPAWAACSEGISINGADAPFTRCAFAGRQGRDRRGFVVALSVIIAYFLHTCGGDALRWLVDVWYTTHMCFLYDV